MVLTRLSTSPSRHVIVAGWVVLALWGGGSAFASEEDDDGGGVAGSDGGAVVISEPQFDPPTVISPRPGEVVTTVQDGSGTWWWILEVTNSDYQPDFDIDLGYVGFDTLPSVGIFDTLSARLEWTNQSFACFLDDTCDQLSFTPDQDVFGEDFVRLPKLFDPDTGEIAYHVEHAFEQGEEPYQWLVGQETLSLAIPFEGTPTGPLEVWVGYTYIYTDDLVGVPVTFTEEAMAITEASVVIPEDPAVIEEPEEALSEQSEGALPTWVISAVVGLVGVVVFFGLLALTVSRGVMIARRKTRGDSDRAH